MMDRVKEMLGEVVADDEFFDLVAKGMRKLHNALIKNGFTPAEATKIVASQGTSFSSK